VAACIPLSLVMTWVFNRTGQSLPIVMILHTGITTTYSSVWTQIFPTLDVIGNPLHVQLIATTVIAPELIIVTRGRLGLSTVPAPTEVDEPRADERRLTSTSLR
jgi:CAAX protease family protein